MTTPHPYLHVQKKWNEELTAAFVAKRNWQVISLIQGVSIVLLIGGFIAVSRQSHIVPYIVEVDAIGRAVATGPAKESSIYDEKMIKAHLYRFIELWRSVITDVEAMRKNLGDAYKMVLPDVKDHVLDPYYKEQDVMALSSDLSRQVMPLSFLKQSDNTYLVEWRETERNKSGQVTHTSQWKALVTLKHTPAEQREKQVMYDPFNPLGIFISGLSWSEIQ